MSTDLPGHVLAQILDLIVERSGSDQADDALTSWDFQMQVHDLANRYRTYPQSNFDVTIVAWLVARLGVGDPTEFEVELADHVGPGHLWAPVWMLSQPIVSLAPSRLPANPFVCPCDPDVERAYRGLLAHLETYDHESAPELHRSAVIWRVGALADGLEPADEDYSQDSRKFGQRLDQIVARLCNDDRLTLEDKKICRLWSGQNFGDRRNALTHLSRRAVSFDDAYSHYTSRTVLLTECAAASLAVLREGANAMKDQAPSNSIVQRAFKEVEWIEP